MKRLTTIGFALVVLGTGFAVAQHAQPYAGLQSRTVKALSDQQVADLKASRGIGMALPAELNGYPGPIHVLELADKLDLTQAQRAEMRRLYEAMKSEAAPLGETLIAQETALDALFAERRVTAESLREATAAIGQTQGALRNTHLKYHLDTAAQLSPAQAKQYAELRGYASGSHGSHHQQQHHR